MRKSEATTKKALVMSVAILMGIAGYSSACWAMPQLSSSEKHEPAELTIQRLKNNKPEIDKLVYAYVAKLNDARSPKRITFTKIYSISTDTDRQSSVVDFETGQQDRDGGSAVKRKLRAFVNYDFRPMQLPKYDGSMSKEEIEQRERELQAKNFGFEVTKLKLENMDREGG
ncbi:hypothetical protein RC144_004353 [Salmonella enterica]|nr:hypothetical protein [Salmonella enterica]ELE3839895.1 hypothetical protein [Salmonella enterica]